MKDKNVLHSSFFRGFSFLVYDFYQRTGSTHKRLGIEEYIDYALAQNADTVAVISSGNLFMELKQEIERRNVPLHLVNLVNEGYKKNEHAIVMPSGRILRDAKEREAYITSYASNHRLLLGNVVDVTDFLPKAYSQEAECILQHHPDYVALPVGSGKLFLSLYRKIKEKNLETRLLGFLPKDANGIFFDQQFEQDGFLYFKDFSVKSYADKLVTPYVLTSYKQEILQALQEGHILYEMTPSEEKKALKIVTSLPFVTEPSSAMPFFVLDEKMRKKFGIQRHDNLVVVSTGKGMAEYDVVTLPISPFQKVLRYTTPVVALVGLTALLLYSSSQPSLSEKMTSLFYQRHHPQLLVEGKLPLLPPSQLDMLMDEQYAFVYGNVHSLYLSKEKAKQLAEEGKSLKKVL